MKKQKESDSFALQPNLKELQVAVTNIMDPRAQQDRELTLAKFGRNTIGSAYIGTSQQESKAKVMILVMQVHESRAQDMTRFLRPFEDVIVQSSTVTRDDNTLAPPGTALLSLLADKEVKLASKVNALGKALSLSKAGLALVMGVSERTIYNWMNGKVQHPDKIKNITALAIIAMLEPTMDTAPQGEES